MNGKPMDLDEEVLLALQAAIGDKTKHIIAIYISEVPKSITAMRIAIQQQDYKTIMLQAHSLKSSSANVGAMYLSKLSAELESKLKNEDHNNLELDIYSIQTAFDQAQPLFGKFL